MPGPLPAREVITSILSETKACSRSSFPILLARLAFGESFGDRFLFRRSGLSRGEFFCPRLRRLGRLERFLFGFFGWRFGLYGFGLGGFFAGFCFFALIRCFGGRRGGFCSGRLGHRLFQGFFAQMGLHSPFWQA